MSNENGTQERDVCQRRLSVEEDDCVRAIRNRLWAAKTRLEEAARYVMFSEVREESRAQADLTLALAYIGR